MSEEEEKFFVGVDCGTASVRAALVSDSGVVVAVHSESTLVNNPKSGFYEQSSDDIWHKTCTCVRSVVEAGLASAAIATKDSICGIGFDATCSLVCLDESFHGVSVSQTRSSSPKPEPCDSSIESSADVCPDTGTVSTTKWDIILWMDHRAAKEAAEINQSVEPTTGSQWDVLESVGGSISAEMQVPKMLWLKRNLPIAFAKTRHFLDLSDFLVFKATQSNPIHTATVECKEEDASTTSPSHVSILRSVCTLSCKWTLRSDRLKFADDSEEQRSIVSCIDCWNTSFFAHIGLQELVDSVTSMSRIGTRVAAVGTAIAGGLSLECAVAFGGLADGSSVGVGMIDAHCGALALLAATPLADCKTSEEMDSSRLALISGTSTCHLLVSATRTPVAGVWGPYCHALVPGMWLLEAGQSATGALLDDFIRDRLRLPVLLNCGLPQCYQMLNDAIANGLLEEESSGSGMHPIRGSDTVSVSLSTAALCARHLHVNPYFHGNRSPLSDPTLRGAMVGLTLDELRHYHQVTDSDFESSKSQSDDATVISKSSVELSAEKRIGLSLLRSAAKLYMATVLAICYDSLSIVDAMAVAGVKRPALVLCTGGLSKNRLFLQMHADILQIAIALPRESESVVVGSAIVAHCAHTEECERRLLETDTSSSKTATSAAQRLVASMKRMSAVGEMIQPTRDLKLQKFHEAKHRVFKRMVDDHKAYESIMDL